MLLEPDLQKTAVAVGCALAWVYLFVGGAIHYTSAAPQGSWPKIIEIFNPLAFTVFLPIAFRQTDDWCRIWNGAFVNGSLLLATLISLLTTHPVTRDFMPDTAFADERWKKPMAYCVWYTTAWLAVLFAIMTACSLVVALTKLKTGPLFVVLAYVLPMGSLIGGVAMMKLVGRWAFAYGAQKELGPDWVQLCGLDSEEGKKEFADAMAGKGATAREEGGAELQAGQQGSKNQPLLSDDHLQQ